VPVLRSPPGRLGNRRGLHAEDGGQRPAGMAEDLDPQVREAGAGLLDGEPAAPAAQSLAGQADVAADPGHEALERQPRGPGGLSRLQRAPEGLHELAGAQHPLITRVGLPAPPEALDHRPAAETAQEAAPLELGPAAAKAR